MCHIPVTILSFCWRRNTWATTHGHACMTWSLSGKSHFLFWHQQLDVSVAAASAAVSAAAMSGWLYHVYSFRKWVHHVHNCWLRSHIEFWILKPTSLDLQLMTFGSKTLMLGCKNRSFWDAKSMILGSEIDLGASWGDLWPILAPRSSLGGILEPITNFRTAFGTTFWSPKTIQINDKNFQKI